MKLKYLFTSLLMLVTGMACGADYTPVDPTSLESVVIYNVGQEKFLVYSDGKFSLSETEHTGFIFTESSDDCYTLTTDGGIKINTTFQGLSGIDYEDWRFTSTPNTEGYYTLSSRQLESNAFAYLYYSSALSSISVMSSKPAAGFTDGQWQFFDPEEVDAEPVVESTLSLTDSDPTLVDGTYKAGNVTYTRSVTLNTTGNTYGSFCIPFDVDLSKTTCFDHIYTMHNLALYANETSKKLRIFFKEKDITESPILTAGTPVVASLTSADISLKNCNQIKYADNAGPEINNSSIFVYNWNEGTGGLTPRNKNIELTFAGTYAKQTNTDISGLESFNSDGSFGSVTYINPFRAYIIKVVSGDNEVKSIDTDFYIDDLTSILSVKESTSIDNIYTLDGRCIPKDYVKDLRPGIYIIDGKKIIK